MKNLISLTLFILFTFSNVSAQIDTLKRPMMKIPAGIKVQPASQRSYIDTISIGVAVQDYLLGNTYTEPAHFYTIPGPTLPESVELRSTSGNKPYGAFFPQGGRIYVQVFLPNNAIIKELRAHICDGEPDADIEINLYEWRNFTQYTNTGPEHYIIQTELTTVASSGSISTYYYLSKPQFIIGPSISTRVLEENAYFLEIYVPTNQVYLVIKDIRIGYN
jgi:hypothetical protein